MPGEQTLDASLIAQIERKTPMLSRDDRETLIACLMARMPDPHGDDQRDHHADVHAVSWFVRGGAAVHAGGVPARYGGLRGLIR